MRKLKPFEKRGKEMKMPPKRKDCYACEHCVYLGDGGYMCDLTNDIVIEDWQPDDAFYRCDGKKFEAIQEELNDTYKARDKERNNKLGERFPNHEMSSGF